MKRSAYAAVLGAAIASNVMLAAITDAQPARSGVVTGTFSGIVPVPVGPLVDNRDVGIGGVAGIRYAMAPSSPFAMRLELAGLLPSSHDNGLPNVTPHITNGNSAAFLTAGPEFDIPATNGHFYTTAVAGLAHVWAWSSAASGPTPDFGPYYTMTKRQATNFAWGAGGGFVTVRSHSGFAGDISLRYYDLGRATYATLYPGGSFPLGSIVTKPNTTIGRHQTTLIAPSIGVSWLP